MGIVAVVKQEIKELLQNVKVDADSSIAASYTFPRSFSAFTGHFPGKPILPGVCQITALIVLLEKVTDTKLKLRYLNRAKFSSPVMPEEEIIIHGQYSATGQEVSAKFRIIKNENGQKVKVSQISVTAEKQNEYE